MNIIRTIVFGVWIVAGLVLPLTPISASEATQLDESPVVEFADAVITYDRPPPTFGHPTSFTVFQHQGMIRIDGEWGSAFTSLGQNVRFGISRAENGDVIGVNMIIDSLDAPPLLSERQFSGAVEQHLGETCWVWQKVNVTNRNTEFIQSGCITSDGIELWRRQADIDYVIATSIERRPVDPEEVRLPTEMLDIANWIDWEDSPDHSGDYEAILEGDNENRQIFRRSGDWTYEGSEQSNLARRDWSVRNAIVGVAIRYWERDDGTRAFTIERQSDERPIYFSPEPRQIEGRADETLLGLSCRWSELGSEIIVVSSAPTRRCLTNEGIPIKIVESGGRAARHEEFVIVSYSDAPQPFESILPGEELVSPESWGL